MSRLVMRPLVRPSAERMAALRFGSGIHGYCTASTVNRMLALMLKPVSSVTVNVIVLVPVWLVVGVTVNVRELLLPLRTRPAFGTSTGLEELTVTANSPLGVTSSQTEKLRVELAFSAMV